MLDSSSRLGPYEIIAPLGAGGMGEVYRARDTRLAREVAVKVLSDRFAGDADLRSRFEREAQAVASLSHPNILAIHDYGTHGTSTYAVMELLEGQTLRDRLAKGALPWRKAAEIAVAIAEGLAAAHAKGITHRDLKPENLFLTTGGSVKILDFGLAQIKPLAGALDATSPPGSSHTEPGAVLGTVGYMAPEQVRGQGADVRSDIFSLGCVLYEMVTGQRAFARETAAETMTAILHDEPTEIAQSGKHVPPEVERVIHHSLEKSRDERFQSARDLSFALKAILTDSHVSGPRMAAPAPARPSVAKWMLAAAALLAIAAISAFLIVPSLRNTPATPTRSVSEGSGPVFDSLAILPLLNETNDVKSEPLCEGLAEHLSGRLAQVGNLKVRPITSTSRYRGQQADPKTVGRELNVNAVVTGRLRQDGETLVISLNLIDARDDSLVWTKSYPGNRQQILELQDGMARDLAGKLGLRLTGEEDQRLTKRHTQDPDAYLLFCEANYHLNKFTPEGIANSIDYCQRSIKKDPQYATAHAALARAYVLLGSLYQGPRQTFPEARKHVAQALALDANQPDALSVLATIYMFHDWDWPAAEREFKRAIESDPNLAVNRNLYGFCLAATGRLPEALASIQLGRQLEPLAAPRVNEVAMCHNWLRQYDQAIAEARKALELNPHFPLAYAQLAQALIQKGRYEQAIEELHKAPQFAKSPPILSLVGCAHALAGQRAEAQKVLAELNDPAMLRYRTALAIARVHAALGEKDEAFEWLDKARDERDVNIIWLKVDPAWDNLRSDRRFDELLQKMRLAYKPTPNRSASEGSSQPIDSLAVLPFVYQSGDADSEFLAEGIPQTLSTSLAQVRTLKVRPMGAVARFKDQAAHDLFGVGKALQVQALVTGKIQKRGERLYLTWQLADVSSNTILDGANYNRPLADLFQLQEDLAKEIAGKLRLRLTGEDQRQLARRSTENLKAFELYTIGRQHFLQFNEQGARKAIDYYQRAIQEDPNYALAYAGLSGAYGVLAANHLSPQETVPKAKFAAAEALRLDETLADSHVAQGAIKLLHDFDWPAALGALDRAEQLQPNNFAPANLRAYYFIAMKRMEEALAEIKRAQALDPTALVVSSDVGTILYLSRQYDQAIAQFRETLKMDSSFVGAHAGLGFAYLQKGQYEEARTALNTAVALSDRSPQMVAALAYGWAVARQPDEARKLLAELLASPTERYVSPYDIALVYTGLRDTEQAIAWLRKAHAERSTWLIFLNVEPCFDNLRSDPRFSQLLQDMGLAEKTAALKDQPIDTLAVLPFDNQSPDPEAGYLGDDITYSLTDSLARIRELKVRPYSSAARFKSGSFDSKTAGSQLQVQTVLRGSIQQRGENVVIDVELIHVGEDRRMWGDRYQGKLTDRLALQRQIIQEVPARLSLSLTGQEKQVLTKLPTQNLKAHELHVQGRLEWNKRTLPGLEKSIELYLQATDLDPFYALAWASLAEAYFVFPINTDTPPKDSMLKAKAAATRALEIDDQLAEAHTVLAAVAGAYEHDWSEAERRYQRALAINPNDATARYRYGQQLTVLGRFDEAHMHSARARELDPLSLIIRAVTGRHFYYARQYDAAIEQYRQALDINPDFWVAHLFSGHAYTQQRKYDEAVGELQRARQLPGVNLEAQASLGYLYAVMGRTAEARQLLAELQALSRQRHVPPFYFAMIHVGLGETDQALDALDKACEERNFFVTLLNVEPMFDSLRDDPRFQKIIADMKFPQ